MPKRIQLGGFRMFNKYPEGYDLTIMDVDYNFPEPDANSKWDKGSITLVAKDNNTGKKIVETIKNPSYTYYRIKPEVIQQRGITTPLKEIEKECVDPVTVPYNELEKHIAEEIGELDFYFSNLKNKTRSANKLLHISNPKIMGSDINIEDFYRFKFAKKFKNSITKINKAFFDIEADIKDMKGDFPEMGECPINAVTLINQQNNSVYVLFLRNSSNPLIKQFEEDLKAGKVVPKFKALLEEHVGGWKNMVRYGIRDFKYHFIPYDVEINLIIDLFAIINSLQPDFVLAWNMAFDIPYIIQRIINLGFNPADIMCHPDFKVKKVSYFHDTRTEVLAERGDFAKISSYSVYLDQMIQHASIRKGQSAYQSYSLDFVTNLICKFGKLDYHSITPYLAELPYVNFEMFIFYNMIDVIDQVCIENKVNDIDFVFTKALNNNTRYEKVHRQTIYLINRLRSEYWDMGYVVGNNVNRMNSKPTEKFAGAFVADPMMINDGPKLKLNGIPVMIYDNLDDYDYRRLYPTMAQEFNMSDGTQIGRLKIPNKVHDKEDISNSGKFFTREGVFFDDIAAKNYLETCTRWFNLADFSTLLDDVEEYFTQQARASTMIPFIKEDGLKMLYNRVNPNKPTMLYRKVDDKEYQYNTEKLDTSLIGELEDVYAENLGFRTK